MFLNFQISMKMTQKLEESVFMHSITVKTVYLHYDAFFLEEHTHHYQKYTMESFGTNLHIAVFPGEFLFQGFHPLL